MAKKILVIGLDGGSFELIESWIRQGELPFFDKIMKRGIYGGLVSIRPPASVPAWPVVFKGKNPGKIGAFYFNWIDRDYKFHYNNSLSLRGENLWDFAGKNKHTVGIFNVPGTHPPEKVNGWMITELSSSDEYTYPKKLSHEIPKEDLGKETNPIRKEYIKFERELEVMKLLLSKKFDLVISVFHLSDLSHQQKAWKADFLKAYKKMGMEFDSVLKEFEDEYNIFIISDHGIQFINENSSMFFISTWLEKNGFLVMKTKRPRPHRALIMKVASKVRELFIKRKWGLPQNLIFLKKTTPPLETFTYENVDFSRTKVFPHIMEPFPSYGLYVNLKERYSRGIVERGECEKIRKELLKTLKRDGFGAFMKEELYSGDDLGRFPDVIVEHNGLISPNLHSELFSLFKSGHSMNGILMAYGPDISERKEIKGARLEDIAPTMLHALSLPVPLDMDGRVLKEIFRKGSDPWKRKIKSKHLKKRTGKKEKKVFTRTDEEKIKERLKSMGYM